MFDDLFRFGANTINNLYNHYTALYHHRKRDGLKILGENFDCIWARARVSSNLQAEESSDFNFQESLILCRELVSVGRASRLFRTIFFPSVCLKGHCVKLLTARTTRRTQYRWCLRQLRRIGPARLLQHPIRGICERICYCQEDKTEDALWWRIWKKKIKSDRTSSGLVGVPTQQWDDWRCLSIRFEGGGRRARWMLCKNFDLCEWFFEQSGGGVVGEKDNDDAQWGGSRKMKLKFMCCECSSLLQTKHI